MFGLSYTVSRGDAAGLCMVDWSIRVGQESPNITSYSLVLCVHIFTVSKRWSKLF